MELESNCMGMSTILVSLIGLVLLILIAISLRFILKIIALSEDEQERL